MGGATDDNIDTIFAPASARGRAGISVLRISGPRARLVIDRMAGDMPSPRKASLRMLQDPSTGRDIDRALILWFPAPASFTGEDIVEIHAHGSLAVVDHLLGLLSDFENFRLAEPGEFARRAFENGKLDLTAVEGLADLINAETQGQRRQALRQSEGELGRLYEQWRKQLVRAGALVEAMIDFSDEEDVTATLEPQICGIVSNLHMSLAQHLEQSGRRGEQMREGFRLVIAGLPNAGKSSLLNRLARREAAIVSSQPGTTRDIIEVRLDIGGFPLIVSDTAGLRETSGSIEREGMKRAIETMKQADLVLYLCEPAGSQDEDNIITSVIENLGRENRDMEFWKILSKADLYPEARSALPEGYDFSISTVSDEGIADLLQRLEQYLSVEEVSSSAPLITRARHRQEVTRAYRALSAFLEGSMQDVELRSEDLRQAALALGRLTGRIDVEELLGHIFDEFCIGK